MDPRILMAAKWYLCTWPVEGKVIFFGGLRIEERQFHKASLIIKRKKKYND